MKTQFQLSLRTVLIYLMCFAPCFGQTQSLDCINAIEICSPLFIQENQYVGAGSVIDEIGDGTICIAAVQESNINWYKFTAKDTSQLTFLIYPNDLGADYDWALFDLTNASCTDLKENANALLISCNAAGGRGCRGITGMTPQGIYDIQGAGCNSEMPDMGSANSAINASIRLKKGNRYVLAIQDWAAANANDSVTAYTLDFSNSSSGLGFETASITDITSSGSICDMPIQLNFSHDIPCENINLLKVRLISKTGQEFIVAPSPIDCIQNPNGILNTIGLKTAFQATDHDGTYQLIIDDTEANRIALMTTCGNTIELPFESEVNLLADNSLDITIRNRTPRNEVCEEGVVILRAEEIFDFLGTSHLYTWTLPDGSTFVGRDLEATSPGTYTVDVLQNGVQSQPGCRRGQATYTIEGGINLDLGPDRNLCTGDSLILEAQEGGLHYVWSTGESGAIITVTESGTYSIIVETDCGEQTSEVVVTFTDIPVSINGETDFDASICPNESITLAANEGQIYDWSNGETSASIDINIAGIYELTVTNAEGCQGTAIATISLATEPTINYLSEPMCAADNQTYALEVHTETGNTLASQAGTVTGSEGTFLIQDIPVEESAFLTISNEIGCALEFAIDSDVPYCSSCPVENLPDLQFISSECKNNGETYAIRINTHPDDVLTTSAGIVAGSFGFLTVYNIPGGEDVTLTLTNLLGCSVMQNFDAPSCGEDINTKSMQFNAISALSTQVQPNPFRTTTTIQFKQNNADWTEIILYDISGKVLVQQRQYQEAGVQQYFIKANQLDNSGVYFYRLQNSTQSIVGKLILQ